VHYSSREKCLRLVADRSLDKSYSSRSEALFHSNGDAGLIPDEGLRLDDGLDHGLLIRSKIKAVQSYPGSSD
jgi:hypothetical protein